MYVPLIILFTLFTWFAFLNYTLPSFTPLEEEESSPLVFSSESVGLHASRSCSSCMHLMQLVTQIRAVQAVSELDSRFTEKL